MTSIGRRASPRSGTAAGACVRLHCPARRARARRPRRAPAQGSLGARARVPARSTSSRRSRASTGPTCLSPPHPSSDGSANFSRSSISSPEVARLLTLTGPGGTGKTRLAPQAAGARADALSRTESSGCRSPRFVTRGPCSKVRAQVLGAKNGLASHIADKRMLLLFERVKALSTEQILSRLERRLPLLTGGNRDAPERQRTLTATIEWSYDLLSSEEQRLFAGLSRLRRRLHAGRCRNGVWRRNSTPCSRSWRRVSSASRASATGCSRPSASTRRSAWRPRAKRRASGGDNAEHFLTLAVTTSRRWSRPPAASRRCSASVHSSRSS